MALTLLSVVFTLLIACLLVTLLSFLYLFLHAISKTNHVLQHPFLQTIPWNRLTLSNKTGILLDYFLRLFFPKSSWSLAKNANQLLAHVNPEKVPLSIKLPILGLWGGCLLGSMTMLVLWVLILVVMNQSA
jgi:hypothetical protein